MKHEIAKSVLMVKEFHDLFEHPVGRVIGQEPLNIRQLRIKLLFEELAELAEASDVRQTMAILAYQHLQKVDAKMTVKPIPGQQAEVTFQLGHIADGDNVDVVEEADALADLQYVLDGKKLTSGLYLYMDEVFEVVHKNNMSKAHRDEEHAIQTINREKDLQKRVLYTKAERDGKWFVYNHDGKLTKPWDHIKVAIAPIIVPHIQK